LLEDSIWQFIANFIKKNSNRWDFYTAHEQFWIPFLALPVSATQTPVCMYGVPKSSS